MNPMNYNKFSQQYNYHMYPPQQYMLPYNQNNYQQQYILPYQSQQYPIPYRIQYQVPNQQLNLLHRPIYQHANSLLNKPIYQPNYLLPNPNTQQNDLLKNPNIQHNNIIKNKKLNKKKVKLQFNESALKNSISEEEYNNKLITDDSIKLKYSLCKSKECNNPTLYHLKKKMFYEKKKENLFCRLCFKLGMKGTHGTLCCEDYINFKKPLNEVCFSKATYGYPGKKPVRCSHHKDDGMINVNVNYCQFMHLDGKRCKEKAEYGILRKERCYKHKITNMEKIFSRKNKRKM